MGEKAKEDVQQGGVVGLEGGSWVAEKNGGNLLGVWFSKQNFSFSHVRVTDTPALILSAIYALTISSFVDDEITIIYIQTFHSKI